MAAPRFFNTLLGVWICDETLFLVFHILRKTLIANRKFFLSHFLLKGALNIAKNVQYHNGTERNLYFGELGTRSVRFVPNSIRGHELRLVNVKPVTRLRTI